MNSVASAGEAETAGAVIREGGACCTHDKGRGIAMSAQREGDRHGTEHF